MKNCEQLLMESISIYQMIDSCYDTMLQCPLGNVKPEQLTGQSEKIAVYSARSRDIDDALKKLLPSTSQQTEKTTELLDKREKIIQELIAKNSVICQKAANVSSALKHEFSNLVKNRTAINQYGQSIPCQRRSMLNNSY